MASGARGGRAGGEGVRKALQTEGPPGHFMRLPELRRRSDPGAGATTMVKPVPVAIKDTQRFLQNLPQIPPEPARQKIHIVDTVEIDAVSELK